MIEPLTFSNAFVQDTKEALGPNCIDFFRKYKKSNGILWFVACKQEQTASKYIRKIIDFLDTKTHLSEESKQTILENWYHLVNQCVQSEPKPVHQTTKFQFIVDR